MKSACTERWLQEMRECAAAISAILAVTHPQLFDAGCETLTHLPKQYPDLADFIEKWPFVFTAVTLISNRESPLHRDTKSSSDLWMDILASIGGDGAVLELASYGVRARWNSGSVAAFCGCKVLHGVSRTSAERLCIACYMKDAVHERAGVMRPGWPVLPGDKEIKVNYSTCCLK